MKIKMQNIKPSRILIMKSGRQINPIENDMELDVSDEDGKDLIKKKLAKKVKVVKPVENKEEE